MITVNWFDGHSAEEIVSVCPASSHSGGQLHFIFPLFKSPMTERMQPMSSPEMFLYIQLEFAYFRIVVPSSVRSHILDFLCSSCNMYRAWVQLQLT